MKIKMNIQLIVCFFVLLAGFPPVFAAEESFSPEAAVLKYKPVLAPQTFKALLRMELERPERPVRKYKISLWQKDPDQVRILFEAPASEKGKILYRQKTQHLLFLPDLEEVVSLPPSQLGGWSFFYSENLFPFYFQKDLIWKAAPEKDGRWLVTVSRPADRHPLAICTLTTREGPLTRVVLLGPAGQPRRQIAIAWESSPAGDRPKSFGVENLEPDPYRARIFIDELQLKPVFPPKAFEIEKGRTGEKE
ncbi:MAG: hypothetical protein HY892_04190 [Deltaproteobacteria bacterium]|nr:hypothetical protein [Deltaproteobacteria bacterium]